MAWTTTDLIASVKRRSGMPAAQASFTNAEVLAIANEEMGSYIVPLVLKQREDYWLAHDEQPLVDGTATYPIPTRCVGGKLREVLLLDTERRAHNITRVSPSDLEGAESGFYVDGDALTIIPDNADTAWSNYETLRMSYFRRPSQLVETSAAGVITDLDATTVTLASVPAAFSGQDSWDLVSARSPFTVRGADQPGVLAGSVITFTGGVPSNVLVGDYVCLPDQSPVPQLPAELHGLLAQKVACRILAAKQMNEKLKGAELELERMERDSIALISPRVDGEAVRLIVRNGLYRM